jgi:hypothetical protein
MHPVHKAKAAQQTKAEEYLRRAGYESGGTVPDPSPQERIDQAERNLNTNVLGETIRPDLQTPEFKKLPK